MAKRAASLLVFAIVFLSYMCFVAYSLGAAAYGNPEICIGANIALLVYGMPLTLLTLSGGSATSLGIVVKGLLGALQWALVAVFVKNMYGRFFKKRHDGKSEISSKNDE